MEELVSGEFAASEVVSNTAESPIAGTSKSAKIQHENLDEIKTSLRRKQILSDLSKILAENQKERVKLLAPKTKKTSEPQFVENADSEENTSVALTSTPIRSKTTAPNNTPLVSRKDSPFSWHCFHVLVKRWSLDCQEDFRNY